MDRFQKVYSQGMVAVVEIWVPSTLCFTEKELV